MEGRDGLVGGEGGVLVEEDEEEELREGSVSVAPLSPSTASEMRGSSKKAAANKELAAHTNKKAGDAIQPDIPGFLPAPLRPDLGVKCE